MPAYTQLTECRCCGSTNLHKYLDLGLMPLANNLQPTKEQAVNIDRYPLQVLFCSDCGLSQLSIIIDPVEMFSNYVYRSGINAGYVAHCRQMAKELQVKHNLTDKSFMVDIAGNDGSLLKEFHDEVGLMVLNIDPAQNLWASCETVNKVRMLCRFWGTETVKWFAPNFPKADLITATNVFAHVHDVKDFLRGAELLLNDSGVLVLEFPYLIDFIEKKEFDTVYFEHLSYFSITPLMWLVTDCGLKIVSVSKQDIHGGTVRVTIAKQWADIPVEQSVDDFVTSESEQGFNSFEKYQDFSKTVGDTATGFIKGLDSLTGTVAAFAASAKGNTLLNHIGITDKHIQFIVDETPEKIGKYSPGTGIPVVDLAHMVNNPPDNIIILSWNFADEIINKCRQLGYTGKFIIPIPEWKVL
jgi:hypothetical protein